MTQVALAERAGISPGFLSELMSGRKEPSMATLRALATALDLGVSDLQADGWSQARSPSAGFAEDHAAAFTGELPDLSPRPTPARPIYTARHMLPALGIMQGDLLVIDLKASAQPGDTVLATEIDDAGAARTIVARNAPPWIIPGDGSALKRVDQSGRLAIPGVVAAVIRLRTRAT